MFMSITEWERLCAYIQDFNSYKLFVTLIAEVETWVFHTTRRLC